MQSIQTFESQTPNDPLPSTSAKAGTSAATPLLPIAPGEVVPYLHQFDFTAFDFAQPTSWELLAKSFQITNGYVPEQAELMGIVMMAMQTIQQQMQMMHAQQQWAAANTANGGAADPSLWYGASEETGVKDADNPGAAIGEQGTESTVVGEANVISNGGVDTAMGNSEVAASAVPSAQSTAEKGDVADPRRRDPRFKAVVEAEGDGDMSLSPSSARSTPLTPLSGEL